MKDKVSKLMDSRWYGQSLCALAVVFAVGCGRDSTENFLSQTPQTSVELTDGTTLEVVASSGNAVSLRTSDGQTVPLERGTAVVGDELVVWASRTSIPATSLFIGPREHAPTRMAIAKRCARAKSPIFSFTVCPASSFWPTIAYAPAESAERKLALAEELERVRSARDQAARAD